MSKSLFSVHSKEEKDRIEGFVKGVMENLKKELSQEEFPLYFYRYLSEGFMMAILNPSELNPSRLPVQPSNPMLVPKMDCMWGGIVLPVIEFCTPVKGQIDEVKLKKVFLEIYKETVLEIVAVINVQLENRR
jgi:hypothetical protein